MEGRDLLAEMLIWLCKQEQAKIDHLFLYGDGTKNYEEICVSPLDEHNI